MPGPLISVSGRSWKPRDRPLTRIRGVGRVLTRGHIGLRVAICGGLSFTRVHFDLRVISFGLRVISFGLRVTISGLRVFSSCRKLCILYSVEFTRDHF